MRSFLLRLLDHRSRLWCVVLVLSMLPILRWLAAILMAVTTLRRGAKDGGLLVLATVLPFLLLVFNQEMWLPVLNQLIETLLLFGLALLLRSYQSWLLLLETVTVLGVIVVGVVHWLNPNIIATWQQFLQSEFDLLAKSVFKSVPSIADLDATSITQMVESFARYTTGLEIVVVSVSTLFNLAVSRYVQATLYNPGGLRRELYALRLPRLLASILVAIALLAVWTQQAILLDCLSVLLLPLVIAGLSLLHSMTAHSKWQSLWLVICYIALLLFPPQVLILLIGASLTDAWWNVRQRFKR